MKNTLRPLVITLAVAIPFAVTTGRAAGPRITPSMFFQQNAVNLEQTNMFTVTASGTGPLAFQWRFENLDLPNQTNKSLTITNAQPEHEGDYFVVVTDASGSITSAPTRLYVVPRQTDMIKDNFTNSAGRRLPYFYLLPANYDPAHRYPLFYWLHGIPGDENMIDKPGGGYLGYGSYAVLKALSSFKQQKTDPVILVWPARRAGDANGDWVGDYPQLLSQLLDHLQLQFSVDTNRIYIDGASGGFHAVWDLVANRRDLVAAARMAAGWAGGANPTALLGVPFWVWCATDDGLVSDTRSAVFNMRRVGAKVIYTEYEVGGHMDGIGIGMVTPVINEWLLSQRKGQASTHEPLLTITNCNPSVALRTGRTRCGFAGVAAALGEPVYNLFWTNYSSSIMSGAISGSNEWQVASIPLQLNRTNIISLTAKTKSWASAYRGLTTFNDSVRVACYPIVATMRMEGTQGNLAWTGGGPPYRLERATDLGLGDWQEFLVDASPPVQLPMTGPAGYYRVAGE